MRVKVAIDLALDRLFDYEVPEALQKKLAVGQLLSVPFGHREARGFAMEIGNRVSAVAEAMADKTGNGKRGFALKPVAAIVDETPFFSPALLDLVKKVAAYTAAPIESVLRAALPAAVMKRSARARELLFVEPQTPDSSPRLTARQKWLVDNVARLGGGWMTQICKELKTTPSSLKALAQAGWLRIEARAKRRDPLANCRILPSKPLPLNDGQQAALAAIGQADRQAVLLFGVTGSGKTEVYLQAIARELDAGRGAIVMVPEIALTPQTVQRFASRFGKQVAVLHSALSDGERYDEWHRIRAGAARVVIGPRSAVWAPVRNLGLIVVDEEHETSYKQDETPRYNARDVAVLRGTLEGARVVLGSATPSLESWLNVQRGKYALAEMTSRAGAGTLPAVQLVEMTDGSIFSPELLDSIRLRLDRHEQTILFLNRRGYSRSAVCCGCGHVIECPDCGIPYTYHRADSCLRCHICGGWIPIPPACPKCSCSAFDFKGVGTQRAEAALAKFFPRARILRMDADSTSRRHSHDDILSAFRRGDADVLLGTQMIAKGLDFPNVTLVGVLNADSSLNMPDFRAGERTYQLLAQVAGRAGRAELPGEVLVQSHDVRSPVLMSVVRGEFAAFAARELQARKEFSLPPFLHLAAVTFRSKDLKLLGGWATMYAASLCNYFKTLQTPGAGFVSDAMPCVVEKAEGWHRWQITVRATQAADIVRAWRWISAARPLPKSILATVDIDAVNLL